MNKSLYTLEEYDYIYKHYHCDSIESIADHLGRSVPSVEHRAAKLGLGVVKPFSGDEVQLAKKYGPILGDALVFLVPDRTTSEVRELNTCVELAH